jgi:hypothetical protein
MTRCTLPNCALLPAIATISMRASRSAHTCSRYGEGPEHGICLRKTSGLMRSIGLTPVLQIPSDQNDL